ncbi:MAG: hypothetical protein AB7O96_05620 [Pseudobdellovibrionaceae bacterium]
MISKRLSLFIAIAALTFGSIVLASALNLQQAMNTMRVNFSVVSSLNTKSIENPSSITTEELQGAIAKIDAISDLIETIVTMIPPTLSDVVPEQKAAFVTAFRDRIKALHLLFLTLKAECQDLVNVSGAERNFSKVNRIVEAIKKCRDQSHDDFMWSTSTDGLHPEACVL